MKKSNNGILFYIWLGIIVTPFIIECCNESQTPPTTYPSQGGYIKPIKTKEFRGTEQYKPRVSLNPPISNSKKGVVLKNGNTYIETGMTSEEIVNQLSLDYQDLYDYYGGAEEIF